MIIVHHSYLLHVIYLKCGLTPLAALGSYMNSIDTLHRTIFGRAGPFLATKFGPPGPVLVDQKLSARTVFSPGPKFSLQSDGAYLRCYNFEMRRYKKFITQINYMK